MVQSAGQQVPINAADPMAIDNRNIATFTATGGTANTITVGGFATTNQGQMITCTGGVNNGKQAFITAATGTTVTFEPMGYPTLTWSAVAAGDTFSVNGTNFHDQYIRAARAAMENPTFAATKVVIVNLIDRNTNTPVGVQATGRTPAQIANYRAEIASMATTQIGRAHV